MPHLLTHAEHQQYARTYAPGLCVHTAAEAAQYLGISESAVRRQCKRLGVQRIAGRTTRGFVMWPNGYTGGLGPCASVLLAYSR